MITVETYDKLEQYVDMFIQGRTNLLLLEGEGGTGKSETVNKLIRTSEELIPVLDSHLTPLANYELLYENKDRKMVFRDIDQLLKNPITVSLLKQVAETRLPKKVSYHSAGNGFPSIPHSFETSSTVLIETNNHLMGNPNVQALATRGQHINFAPTQEELLKKMEEIATKNGGLLTNNQKKEVYLHIKTMIGQSSIQLNLRHLVNGFGLYSYSLINSSFSWEEELKKGILGDERQSLVVELASSGLNVNAQFLQFRDRTSLSRAQFFRLRKAFLV